eukprot:Ihof_evm4s357 gene=Ihof_evmTU4s357
MEDEVDWKETDWLDSKGGDTEVSYIEEAQGWGDAVDTVEEGEEPERGGEGASNASSDDQRVGKKAILSRISLNPYKAGLNGFDKNKIDAIIYETSKNTPYFKNEEKKAERVYNKTVGGGGDEGLGAILLQRLDVLRATGALTSPSLVDKVDRHVIALEAERDLTHACVHVDMDAFFASVEMRDNPALKDKPMAVGGMSMLSTANYKARQYGVRSAMPGYIALKLCPHLIMVPQHFPKYKEVSRRVGEILAKYDPDYEATSLDEAYLDITDYIIHSAQSAEEVVTEIRRKVEEKTQLTMSAGIAANYRLAKVCSDLNKPNGQYSLPRDRQSVIDFVNTLPIRKAGGIGKVTEQILLALGITQCGHLYEQRQVLWHLFSPVSFDFFMRVALGLGSTEREGTFHEMSSLDAMLLKCHGLCEALADDLVKNGWKVEGGLYMALEGVGNHGNNPLTVQGRTVTLKLKTVDFDVRTRATTFDRMVKASEDLFDAARKLLVTEYEAGGGTLRLRLMGIRLSGLQGNAVEKPLGQNTITSFFGSEATTDRSDQEGRGCPVCGQALPTDDDLVNKHIDDCLSKKAVQELLQEQNALHTDRLVPISTNKRPVGTIGQ